MKIQEIKLKAINLLELISFAERGALLNWQDTVRASVRTLAKDEVLKYDQAMDALRYISSRASELKSEPDEAKILAAMRKFGKIAEAVLASEK
jgi:uncharacterized protein YbjT (DUF2867 family)